MSTTQSGDRAQLPLSQLMERHRVMLMEHKSLCEQVQKHRFDLSDRLEIVQRCLSDSQKMMESYIKLQDLLQTTSTSTDVPVENDTVSQGIKTSQPRKRVRAEQHVTTGYARKRQHMGNNESGNTQTHFETLPTTTSPDTSEKLAARKRKVSTEDERSTEHPEPMSDEQISDQSSKRPKFRQDHDTRWKYPDTAAELDIGPVYIHRRFEHEEDDKRWKYPDAASPPRSDDDDLFLANFLNSYAKKAAKRHAKSDKKRKRSSNSSDSSSSTDGSWGISQPSKKARTLDYDATTDLI